MSTEKHRTGKFARKIASKLSLGKSSKDKHGSSSTVSETSGRSDGCSHIDRQNRPLARSRLRPDGCTDTRADAHLDSNLSEASSQPDTPKTAAQVVKVSSLDLPA